MDEIEKFPDVSNVDLIKQILIKRGFNASYKDNYFFRRLHIRMRKKGCNSYEQYYYLLNRSDNNEFDLLKKNLSINVTSFFRNPDTYVEFKDLFTQYMQNFVKRKANPIIRIWSAGCAIGAEPYTIAMIVDQVLGHRTKSFDVKIMATDFNEELLSIARRGIYDAQLFTDTSEEVLLKYFEPFGNSQYRLKYSVKRLVDFSYLDLMSNTFPFKQLDFIFCRNVLIYFSREQQEQLFSRFHDVIIDGGMLILGRTETIPPSHSNYFKSLSLKHRIYQKQVREDKSISRGFKQENRYSCSQCNETFHRLIDLKIHERGHLTKETGFRCKICSKILQNELRLNVHMKYAHQIDVEAGKIARVEVRPNEIKRTAKVPSRERISSKRKKFY